MYPIDDLHRLYRPAALIASAGAGKQANEAFASAIDVLAPKPKKPTRPIRAARIIEGTP